MNLYMPHFSSYEVALQPLGITRIFAVKTSSPRARAGREEMIPRPPQRWMRAPRHVAG